MLYWIKMHATLIGVMTGVVGMLIATCQITPTWYEDGDGDYFGNPEKSISRIWHPKNHVINNRDCYDSNKFANPNSLAYFQKDRGDGSFDYDCNGESQREITSMGSCSNGTANQGWEGNIPTCGTEGIWLVDCDRKLKGVKIKIVRETKRRIQKCK